MNFLIPKTIYLLHDVRTPIVAQRYENMQDFFYCIDILILYLGIVYFISMAPDDVASMVCEHHILSEKYFFKPQCGIENSTSFFHSYFYSAIC